MKAFEKFIFKNGKHIYMYSDDGAKPATSSGMWFKTHEIAELVGCEHSQVVHWFYKEERDEIVMSGFDDMIVTFSGFLAFVYCADADLGIDGALPIAKELTDCLTAIMVDKQAHVVVKEGLKDND